jgi:hypothetical protein
MRALPTAAVPILCRSILSWLLLGSVSLADTEKIEEAIAACRELPRGLHLSADKSRACFEGPMFDASILTELRRLTNGGTFVIKSSGGDIYIAMRVANLLRERNARVVTYDLCLSACANALFVATHRTIVAAHTVVAWHGAPPVLNYCPSLEQMLPSTRYDQETVKQKLALYCANLELVRTFYASRGLDGKFAQSPQTPHTRKARTATESPSDPRAVFWMWHPDNHQDAFRGRVIYLGYPAGQNEVDTIAARHGLLVPIIYDPPKSALDRRNSPEDACARFECSRALK